VLQEKRSIFWEVIVSAILSKKVYMYMCPIPNGSRDRAISLYRRATRHVLTRVAKCIDVDGGIFETVLYQLNCTNFVTWTINTGIRKVLNISLLSTIFELYSEIAQSRKPLGIGYMYIYTFCLEWPILGPPRILTFLPGTPSIIWILRRLFVSVWID
jgi:hypothetical protein